MYLLSHASFLLRGPQTDDDVTGPLEDGGRTTLGARTETLDRGPFVDTGGSDHQAFWHIFLHGASQSRPQELIDKVGATMLITLGQLDRLVDRQASDKIRNKTDFASGDPHIAEDHSVLPFYSSFDFSHGGAPYLA
jgi:hypothetical protein